MWWGYHGFPFFGLLFFTLLVVFLVFRIITFRRYSRQYHHWNNGQKEAEAILKKRLAEGKIDEAEYERIKEILSN